MLIDTNAIYKSRKAILQTLLYSDLFDFPLKKDELWYFLKSRTKISKTAFLESLRILPFPIVRQGNYYFLSNRETTIPKRKEREKISSEKYLLAEKATYLLSFIPTIYFIGISGSLAYSSADEADDIDLFFIVKKNTVWMSRLASLLLLQIIGMRRMRKLRNEKDKVCINMIIDEQHLGLNKDRHDVYTAHEIAQLAPLFERNDMYERFLKANKWISGYMPNVLDTVKSYHSIHRRGTRILSTMSTVISIIFLSLSKFFETVARNYQLRQINKHKTSETVSDVLLAFHPYDYRQHVLLQYEEKLKAYKIK